MANKITSIKRIPDSFNPAVGHSYYITLSNQTVERTCDDEFLARFKSYRDLAEKNGIPSEEEPQTLIGEIWEDLD